MKITFAKIILGVLSLYLVFSYTNALGLLTNTKLDDFLGKYGYSTSNLTDEDKIKIINNEYDTVFKFDILNEGDDGVLVKSVKKYGNNFYKVIIKTELSKNEVSDYLSFFDNSIIVKEKLGDLYFLEIPFGSKVANGLLKGVDNGTLPSKLFDFDIVEPTVFKAESTSSYLNGELLGNMWGISTMGTYRYQEGLNNQKKMKIGVIDSGIDYTHSDLATQMYTNTGEIAGNGIDDDNNGYIDDVMGYDFYNNDNDPMDDFNHGTPVAGMLGAAVNGGGVFGNNSNVEMMSLKVLNNTGLTSLYDILEAMDYAINNGVDIINMSLGGTGDPSVSSLCTTLDYALSQGILTVSAAGNSNTDNYYYIPGSCENSITVGAVQIDSVDHSLSRAPFSNYGDRVTVAAPGAGVYTSILDLGYGAYGYVNGTSISAPFITGLVSAMLTYEPTLTLSDIKDILTNPVLTEDVITGTGENIGRLPNAFKIFSSMGISDDDGIIGNILPYVTIDTTELYSDTYEITVNASDIDGVITNYEYLVGGQVVGSGSNVFNISITQDTEVTVLVYDDTGDYTMKTVQLFANVAPTVVLSFIETKHNVYDITATANDVDGTITNYDFYIDGVLEQSGISNTFNGYRSRNPFIVRVVVTDNDQATGENQITIGN